MALPVPATHPPSGGRFFKLLRSELLKLYESLGRGGGWRGEVRVAGRGCDNANLDSVTLKWGLRFYISDKFCQPHFEQQALEDLGPGPRD